ncbi:nicotinate phosphoribosyltransferase [Parasphaerochaeta coccoides]|uniref:Nicotinate phosphoribosyltransferase n=1 Tax=Parasphaerochaeta coccoides (strain ATCC BAA-1237 / DSM 17374 / SPN1) TaxID=760011 RepID=F4GIK6_PARC1|nr:nicotinate phosphoribosyltransferase [Parasphaerochaeta coccoides]AEC02140.1 nicotinate phosphoribosyltransferase [Parasphaerochaeta coccoides DSM 17374]
MSVSGLNTDFYELTMMQGFFLAKHNPGVVFDMFYRTNPFNGGYAVFTGLNDLLDKLEDFTFSDDDIAYLASLKKFKPEFLEFLASYHFSGSIHAMDEGTMVFPGEPLVRVHTSLIDALLIETFLLNTLNFQTLIATKAARMSLAASGGPIMEFGYRRAQGIDGALSASRASFIGGTSSTSNTLAGMKYGIPVAGTMAHSWVMSFSDELEAFREFARLYPDNAILLIDTYDTLGSGIENALIVGKELKKKNLSFGVRIDSGDLNYLSRAIRKRLDEAGLEDARIIVSNDITEDIIQTLVHDKVPIDSWGIGTHLVTGGTQSSLNGVYKLCSKQDTFGQYIPTLKVSNSYEKTTLPGIKQVWRFSNETEGALADLVTLEDETPENGCDHTFFHPFTEMDFFVMKAKNYTSAVPLLSCKMKDGKKVGVSPSLTEVQDFARKSLDGFHASYKRLINPHIYKVSLSRKLKDLKTELIMRVKKGDA